MINAHSHNRLVKYNWRCWVLWIQQRLEATWVRKESKGGNKDNSNWETMLRKKEMYYEKN